ncbi:hypothetical protein HDU77_011029 [Chytriomyces hyalinus]|nr:hypothetical protein HDU77_011029 [Chytriomyces hyalinus]
MLRPLNRLPQTQEHMRSELAALRSEVAAFRSEAVDVATLKVQVAALMEARAIASQSSASVPSLEKLYEVVTTLQAQYMQVRSELDAWKREVPKIVIEHTRAEQAALRSQLTAWMVSATEIFQTTADHQPQPLDVAANRSDDEMESEISSLTSTAKGFLPIFDHQPQPLDVAANRSDDDTEADTRLTARWKAVLKEFHPNAPILQYLNEDPLNRPLLKKLRVFIDEFYEARNMKKDQRIREIPTENHTDFVEFFVAKCKSFTGENVNEGLKKRINSAFDVLPLANKFSVNVGAAKSVRANSGGGRGGSTGKKRPHASVGTDGGNTPSKQKLEAVNLGLERVESEEAGGQASVGDT